MSRFFSNKYDKLIPYTPGEQPQNMKYVKLNTNESPFPPSAKAKAYAANHLRELNLYSDPNCVELRSKLAELYEVEPDELVLTNGSDDILNFALMAFCDEEHPAAFADISYSFYPVLADLNNVESIIVPLKEDFTIDVDGFCNIGATVFIPNPNAPTGVLLELADVERIVSTNPNNVVVIDEAYIDFGGKSAVQLIHKYPNLLVSQTFSKSRSMAGARLGMGFGSKELIADINTLRYSTNPYNVNSMTAAMGLGLLEDEETTRANCEIIIENREYTQKALEGMGFQVLPSTANFIFARSDRMNGGDIYDKLKAKGVLVRHFGAERISDWNRISIGTREQMDILIDTLEEIFKEAEV